MERLKGKTIFIGKEPEQGRLLVAVMVDGQPKTATIGNAGSVPNSVSRCKLLEGTAHCKIAVDLSGSMVVSNLKQQNVTFVDGMEIESKKINSTGVLTLGKDKYTVDINTILNLAVKMVGEQMSKNGYSLKHLEAVYKEYEERMDAIQLSQQERARRRMLPMMLGSVSSVAAPILASVLSSATLYITVPFALGSFLIYVRNYREKDTSIEDRKAVNYKFMTSYVCPNPDCNHFMGNQPYLVLKQNKKCPYCGCVFSEK